MQPVCKQCGSAFIIAPDDLAFYDKVSPVFNGNKELIPPPTLCPECRMQRRWAWRNERTLYRRTSDASGVAMVSLYAPDSPHRAYREEEWWNDDWDPLSYGREIDLSVSFLQQFHALLLDVPRRGMHRNGTNENCEYATLGGNNKDCYLAFACLGCEGVLHGTRIMMARNVVDSFTCIGGENLSECLDCMQCHTCFFCQDVSGCHDSMFLEQCRNCSHCISCKNLRNVEYHIRNEQVSPEEFARYRDAILSSHKALQEERTAFHAWKLRLPSPAVHRQQTEESTGDYLDQALRCYQCFDVLKGAVDCRHCQFCGAGAKDLMDCCMAGDRSELLYEAHALSTSQQCIGATFGNALSNVLYGDCLWQCADCFGCTGLRFKSHCILNKQYSKEEYEALVPKIIEKMKADGEWGEFFPVTMSPFAYNETVAQEYFPLSKEEVLARGWKWRNQTDEMPKVDKIIPASQLPDSIDDIPDDILNWAIECDVTKRPFKIIKQELEFYRNMRLPVPRLHPDERHRRRMALRNPRKLWKRECQKCGKDIETSYAPDRPEIVYCESCYLASVY